MFQNTFYWLLWRHFMASLCAISLTSYCSTVRARTCFCLFQRPGWKLKGTELAVEAPRLGNDLPEKSGQLSQWSPLSTFWKRTRIRKPFLILLVLYFLTNFFFPLHCIGHYAPNSFFDPFSFKTWWFYDFCFILLPSEACCNVDF